MFSEEALSVSAPARWLLLLFSGPRIARIKITIGASFELPAVAGIAASR
jgi:hypothetical protein